MADLSSCGGGGGATMEVGGGGEGEIAGTVIELVNEIASISDFRPMVKKQYCNLAHRLKLLVPLFEEIRDIKDPITQETSKSMLAFKEALESAKELLKFCCDGSKIYMVESLIGMCWGSGFLR